MGQVKEEGTKVPLEGVTIRNHQARVFSDKGGFFKLKARVGDTISIRSVGFENQVFLVKNPQEMANIWLTPASTSLQNVEVSSGIGTQLLRSVYQLDLAVRPLTNSQEVLWMVPGLFIGQHAGGGKAEQLFLRGFDVDHGTDVNVSVDGMPVNMVSHAHGQGYADLHFVIPETIKQIDFGKGTYYADKGDFTTAGYVALQTFDKLPSNLFKTELGLFNTIRSVGMMNILPEKPFSSAYVAGEVFHTDGPFNAPQNFRRYNVLGKYQWQRGNTLVNAQISTFWSRWNASGQIPERAVNAGQISWFGAIDSNEGGETARTNVNLRTFSRLSTGASIENQLYYSHYLFELYSNFTFFKMDPVYGDQIKQKEGRNLWGYSGTYVQDYVLSNGASLQTQLGAQVRYDQIGGLELSRTYQREIVTEPLSKGNGNELLIAAFVSETYRQNNWLINAALRVDHFNFDYQNHLIPSIQKPLSRTIFSPKLNIQYQLSAQTALYLKSGKGFHSNDMRAGYSNDGLDMLPAAWGADVGIIAKPSRKMVMNLAFWGLKLNQEFIYVGDEAVVELAGKTWRKGAEISLRYEFSPHLFADLDMNYTIGRAIDEPLGNQYLPLAPVFSSTGGIQYVGSKVKGGLRFRSLGDRPANEDNSVVAQGYTILDANFNYQITKRSSFGFSIENLLNAKWKETQFLTESKLKDEASPIEEIHFTPGTPFFLRVRWTYAF
jgi:outer membrane receptor protein involved in Fe transport